MRRSLVALLLIVCAVGSLDAQRTRARRIRARPPVQASTCVGTAVTGLTSAALQSAVNSAVSNDVLCVAAGTWDITSTVTVSGKSLTLQGAGAGSTILNINVAGANDGFALTATQDNFIRVTGFTFKTVSALVEAHIKITGTNADNAAVRIDHNTFDDNNTGSGYRLIHWEKVYGVVDHNTFTRAICNTQSIEFMGDIGNVGYPDWQRPYTPGTSNAEYAEDNTFTHGCFGETAIDQYSSRAVFRYNTVNGSATGDHGVDSGGRRSKVSFEGYRNTFTNNLGQTYKADDNRGGVDLIFDNTYNGSGTPYSSMATHYARATNNLAVDPGFSGWGYCDGTDYDVVADGHATTTAGTATRFRSTDNETTCTGAVTGTCTKYFDFTSATHGYPCRDQPGFKPGQVLEGSYQWNNQNLWNATMQSWIITEGACLGDAGTCSPLWMTGVHISNFIQENREIYNGKATAQTTSSAPFDGSTGVGWGPLSKMPSSCTNGTVYFATDQGTWNKAGGSQGVAYRCAIGSFSVYYTPYTYPHPLQQVVNTSFPLTENPINESGRWVTGGSAGLSWTNPRTTTNFVFGTQSSGGFDDSIAVLSGTGYGANQIAEAIVALPSRPANGSGQAEVEVLLHATLTPNVGTPSLSTYTGYECNLSVLADGSQYTQVVKLTGTVGSFTLLASQAPKDSGGTTVAAQTGDVLKCTAIGSTITSYLNGVQQIQVTDNTYTGGTPGLGFYKSGTMANSGYGFSRWVARTY